MPTPLPPQEKADFIAIVQSAPYPGGPREADRLLTILNNYEDIFTAICRQLTLFASNNAYLTEAMKVFDQPSLVTIAGIWNSQTYTAPPATDPVAIINTTVTDPVLFTTNKYACIIGSSRVSTLDVAAGFTMEAIYVGPASQVDFVTAAKTDTVIKMIMLPFLRSTPSRLEAVEYGSVVNSVSVEQGSYFGGYWKNPTTQKCAQPITGLTVGTVTHNTVPLTWTPPAGAYLFINVYYRPKGSNDWLLANDTIGYFNAQTGYTFNSLTGDTKYEFRVIVVCNNGGWSAAVDKEAQTICC